MSVSVRRRTGAELGEAPFPWLGLVILAGAIFVCVTGEFLPTGLLPELAVGLDVEQSTVGALVTLYAGAVVVSAPVLTSLTRRVPRKTLVIAVLCLFAITNLLVAVATEFWVVVLARVIGGIAHGMFWSVVGAYSAHLVPKRQLARAIAITSGGGSAAFVLGVPLGTALGHALGWRLAFVVAAAVVVLLVVLVMLFLPPVDHVHAPRAEEVGIRPRRDPSVHGIAVLCVIVAVVMIGQNVLYTFIVPFLTEIVGLRPDAVSLVLFVFGAAGAVGLVLVAFVANRFPRRSLVLAIGVVLVAVLALGLLPDRTPLVISAVVLWGAAFAAVPPLIQTRLLKTASPALRDQASAWMTVAFNLGIGGGALVGGVLLDTAGLRSLPFADVGILSAAIVLVLVTDRVLERRTARSG